MPQREPLEFLQELAEKRAALYTSQRAIRDKLRELLNVAPKGESPMFVKDVGDLPPVPDAPMFRPYPVTLGSKDLVDAVGKVIKLAPQLQGQSKLISYAPTRGTIELFMDATNRPDISEAADTGLMGVTSRERGKPVSETEVYVNPSLDSKANSGWARELRESGSRLDMTTAHELSHTAGRQEADARLVSELVRRYNWGDIPLPRQGR